MLTNLNPGIVFIEGKYINVENVDKYTINEENLFIVFEYYNGDTDLFRFGSILELHKAVIKLDKAQQALDFDFNSI
jgi:hypothetical protein